MNPDRKSAQRRHPSSRAAAVEAELWTSVELSAPVEAIRMLELAELISEPEQKGDDAR